MEKIELAPDVYLNIGGFIREALLTLPSLLIWFVIIVLLLFKSYQGIKNKITGSKYIFFGVLGSVLFSIVSSGILINYEHLIEIYPSIQYFIEPISSLLLLISCWGFKKLIDSLLKVRIST